MADAVLRGGPLDGRDHAVDGRIPLELRLPAPQDGKGEDGVGTTATYRLAAWEGGTAVYRFTGQT